MTRTLTVLISTHDRAALLERALRHLNEARRPPGWAVEILVVANACTDATHELLARYSSEILRRRAANAARFRCAGWPSRCRESRMR